MTKNVGTVTLKLKLPAEIMAGFAEVEAIRARIDSINAMVTGMELVNRSREQNGLAAAYGEDEFVKASDELTEMVKKAEALRERIMISLDKHKDDGFVDWPVEFPEGEFKVQPHPDTMAGPLVITEEGVMEEAEVDEMLQNWENTEQEKLGHKG